MAIALIAANVSIPVGMIWLAGSVNPYRPVSLSSRANAYFTPRTPYAQSFVDPELASKAKRKSKNRKLLDKQRRVRKIKVISLQWLTV